MWAIITGGAARIGLEICKHLASQKYNIILHYNTADISESLNILKQYQVQVIPFQANFSKNKDIKQFIKLLNNYSNIKIVVNNAAVFENDNILSNNFEKSFKKHLMVNYISRIVLLKKIIKNAIPALNKLNKIDIINLLDYGIFKVPHNFFSYHVVNKMMHLSIQMIAKQLIPIAKVNGIALGQTLKNKNQSQKNFDDAIISTPLMCSSTINELLNAIDFILSVNSMTGQIICLDGGMSIADDKYK